MFHRFAIDFEKGALAKYRTHTIQLFFLLSNFGQTLNRAFDKNSINEQEEEEEQKVFEYELQQHLIEQKLYIFRLTNCILHTFRIARCNLAISQISTRSIALWLAEKEGKINQWE